MPVPRSSFVGRAAELARARDALNEHRLVTITGLGGTGKTRLAMELAAGADELFAEEAAVAELAPVVSVESVVAAVAGAISKARPPRGPDPLGQLIEELRGRELLLVLDNCEHVLAAASGVADRLLDGCPSLAVLATSREPLHLDGEYVLSLAPFDVEPCAPHAPSHAVQLFVDRASAVRNEFELGETNLPDVLAICREVDGIPLAIELAAARVAHLSLAEIAQRLTEQRAFASQRATTPDRHRTLTATLEWSYELLTAAEQTVFRQLGVFAAGATLDAVEAVCSISDDIDILEVVSGLVDKNLVTPDHQDDRSRYGMIGIVRRHACRLLDRSDETTTARRRHARWFARLGGRAQPGGDDSWAVAVHEELDDVLAALRWANSCGAADLAYPLAIASGRGCEITGRYAEGREILDTTLQLPADEHRQEHARALVAAAQLSFAAGAYELAHRHYEQAIDELRTHGDGDDLARALNSMATTLLFEGDAEGARRLAEEALQHFDEPGGHPAGRAFARSSLGMIEARTGKQQDAERHLLEALHVFRRLGHKQQAASVLNNLGNLAADSGAPGRAHRFYEGALQLQREIGDDRGAALSLNNLCIVARQRGNLDRAWEHAQAAHELFTAIGDRPGQAATINNLANLAAERDQIQQAIALYGDSITAFREMRDGLRMATALTNLADLAEGIGQRQLAWDCHINATSVWNQMALPDRVRQGLRSLNRLAKQWGLPAVQLDTDPDPESHDPESHDPETISHLLESARWVPIPPPPRAQRPAANGTLTPRETQVVEHVSKGLSNAQIAAQLFISERTVESHISNARQKLRIDSRTKLTRWAIKHGLSP